jgi:NADH-quinone oxidoreductase subunit A
MLWEYGTIMLFIVFGLAFVVVNILLSRLLTWFFNIQKRDPRKHTTYECGEDPVGDARVRFNPRFYIVALVFLIFDVEVIFILPIAVYFQQNVALAMAGGGLFLFLLLAGLVYDWSHGDLDWVKPKPRFTRSDVSS